MLVASWHVINYNFCNFIHIQRSWNYFIFKVIVNKFIHALLYLTHTTNTVIRVYLNNVGLGNMFLWVYYYPLSFDESFSAI